MLKQLELLDSLESWHFFNAKTAKIPENPAIPGHSDSRIPPFFLGILSVLSLFSHLLYYCYYYCALAFLIFYKMFLILLSLRKRR